MFEVKFNDENIDIEKSIKNSKKKILRNKPYLLSMLIHTIITSLSALMIILLNTNNTPVSMTIKLLSLIISGINIHGLAKDIYKIFNNIISKISRKHAKINLDNISETLNNNKVNTNTKELTNSVIIENTYTNTNEVIEDGINFFTEEVTHDKYYLFLDEKSNICGLLEKEVDTTTNDDTTNNRTFHILEEDDINRIKHKVVKTRKLVKTPNIEIKK